MPRDDEEFTAPREIDEYADRVPDKYLACRVNQHSRDPVPSSSGLIKDMVVHESLENISGATWVKTMRCRNRCGIVWLQICDEKGAVLWDSGPDYSRAPGYLTRGLGRFTKEYRDRLRLEEMTRMYEREHGSGTDSASDGSG